MNNHHLDLLILAIVLLAFAVVAAGEVCTHLPADHKPGACAIIERAP